MPTRVRAAFVPRYENFSPRDAASSRVGAGNRRQDTTPEILLRAALRRAGARVRSHVKALPGCPDFVFSGSQVVVFCDGDFWHGRHWTKRKEGLAQGWNAEYWVAKIARNRQRDRAVRRALEAEGWRVIRVWENDVRRAPGDVARRILRIAG